MSGRSLRSNRHSPWSTICSGNARCARDDWVPNRGQRSRRLHSVHHLLLCLCTRQHQISGSLHHPHLILPFFHVALGVVVHPKSHERHPNSQSLYGVYTLIEPDYCNADNSNPLNKRGDRVCHRGGGGEDYECYYVLGKMNGSVHEEVVCYRVWNCMSVRWVRDGGRRRKEDGEIVIQPDRDHEHESHTR